MRILLDTNIIIDAVGGSDPAVQALEKAIRCEWVGYSAITRLELFGYPGLTHDEEKALAAVIGELNEVPIGKEIIGRAIAIRKAVRIKTPDALIAATALEMCAVLYTRNDEDFRCVKGLQVTNPWC